MTDWDSYTTAEVEPLYQPALDWLAARAAHDYERADALRAVLLDAGVILKSIEALPNGNVTLETFVMRESSAHRYARLSARRLSMLS